MKQKTVVFLKGKKVVLRPLEKEDVEKLVVWINDPEVTQYLSMNMPMTRSKEEEWYDNISKSGTDIVLGITVDGKLIGNMSLNSIDWVARNATTGAMIGEKEYWGKGYGTDAKMILLDYAFNTLGLHRINSSAIAFNERSVAYNKHCGYKVEGTRRDQFFLKGKFWDEVILGVLKEDWLPYWKKYKKGLKKSKK